MNSCEVRRRDNVPLVAPMNEQHRILITGGTEYVGGRLIPLLQDRDSEFQLRLMAGQPDYLRARVGDGIEIIAGDVTQPATLDAVLQCVDTAYYLGQSMGSGGDFEDRDLPAARNFADAAKANDVKPIIYLGGRGDHDEIFPKHLRSGHEVCSVSRESGVQVIELQASIVIGSGSLSFEVIRALVQKLHRMICPKWVSTCAQPIAIEDVLAYLCLALEHEPGDSRAYEIAGLTRFLS